MIYHIRPNISCSSILPNGISAHTVVLTDLYKEPQISFEQLACFTYQFLLDVGRSDVSEYSKEK